MNEHTAIRAASALNALAGIWLFVSPWCYGGYKSPAAWNSWIVGIVIVLFSAIRIAAPAGTRAASVLNLLLGAYIFASPWIFGYSGMMGLFVNSLCVGAIVFVLSAAAASIGIWETYPQLGRTS
ncbi:MAG: SPW repeat protein [Bryobacterales bacterium]|nr:SPW repeat protein [Bryobacterales bacterium]MBV9399741.1 SPW repeat protein [Bryobacterales bacterium]